MTQATRQTISCIMMAVVVCTIIIAFCFRLADKSAQKDNENTRKLNSVKFYDVVKIPGGFYKDCNFIIEERKTYWVFSGTVRDCTGNPDVIISDVEIDAKDFIQGLN